MIFRIDELDREHVFGKIKNILHEIKGILIPEYQDFEVMRRNKGSFDFTH